MRRFFAWHRALPLAISLSFLGSLPAAAAEAPAIDTGDTAWLLVSTALVMLMTPGLALFYGGMVRHKNVLSTMMYSFAALAVATLQWVTIGYSQAFGPSKGGLIGDMSMAFLRGVGQAPSADYASTTPQLVFMAFQMMFAIITPALISGAVAERMKFGTFVVFVFLWNTLVYAPIAHWVWNVDGWLLKLGALDFAGGTVVHISSGVSALVAAILLRKRLGYGREAILPNSVVLTVAGAGLLWFGWFGFNGGSAVASNGLATSAFVVTHIASAGGTLGWLLIERLKHGRGSALGAASGCVAGLVAITPASGFVAPMPALFIGLLAGVICYLAVNFKTKAGYDDALDAFGVHGIGGTLGAILTGVFATTAVNPDITSGVIGGNWGGLGAQLIAVAVTWVYAAAVTFVILKVLDAIMGLRVRKDEELEGLDITQHGETGYNLLVR